MSEQEHGSGWEPGPITPPPPSDPPFAPPMDEPVPPPRPSRPSISRYAVIGVVVVALAAGAVFVSQRSGSSSVFAASPTEAVENMISVVGEGRLVDIFRAEYPWLSAAGSFDQATLEANGLPEGRITGFSLKAEDLTYEVEEVGTELAIVTVLDGSITYTVAFDELPPQLRPLLPPGLPTTRLEQTLSLSLLKEMACSGASECPEPSVVTVRDEQGWRVSWMHTAMHLSGAGELQPREASGAVEPEGFEPRLEAAIESRDPNRIFDLLDPAEFPWLTDFRFPKPEPSEPGAWEGEHDLEFEVVAQDDQRASIQLAGFHVISPDGSRTSFDGECLIEDGTPAGCLGMLAELDLGPFKPFEPLVDRISEDGIRFGAVRRDGLWYLSAGETLAPYADLLEDASAQMADLYEDCRGSIQNLGPNGGWSGYSPHPSSGSEGSPLVLDPFEDVPEQCRPFLFGPFGMFIPMRSTVSESVEFEATPLPAP